MSETIRRLNNRDKALQLLKARRRVSNFDLMQVAGTRAGSRVHELRKAGWQIRTEHGHGAECFYVLEGEPVQASLL